MKPGRHLALSGFVVAAIALSSSCIHWNSASSQPAGGKRVFAVKVPAAPFYYYGPRQASGPDKTLPKDTRVAMIRASFGHCKVRLASGEEGYVANDDLHVVSSVTVEVAAAQVSRRPANSQVAIPAPNPDFEPTPIPIPPEVTN
jgi:hypothetical protein